jgi:hypothetical protein
MAQATWTILVYIAAHNNLDEDGRTSAKQIMKAGSTQQVNSIVLFDGKAGAGLYAIDITPGTGLQKMLGRFDSGDPQKLLEIAQWTYANWPAENYGLILWSHGNGWTPDEIGRIADDVLGDRSRATELNAQRSASMPGRRALFKSTFREIFTLQNANDRAICFDDGSHHSLDTLALDRVTTAIANLVGKKLDLLGMDACLMATIEIAYQLRKSVAYLVASEELVPSTSWPYNRILGTLGKQPELTAQELSELIVKEYVDYYRHYPPAIGYGDVTKIALDLSKIDVFVAAMKRLAEVLTANMLEVFQCLENAQNEAFLTETLDEQREDSKFYYHLWDIVSVANHLASNCTQVEVKSAAKHVVQSFKKSGLVVRSGCLGDWFDSIGGLSVYWVAPKKNRPRYISRYYQEVDYARDAKWHDMLQAYRYQE